MGSPDAPKSDSASAALPPGPETLARVVLRCRELGAFVDAVVSALPARHETPFLYGQLDDVLRRLQSSLKQLAAAEPAREEKSGSFLRKLAGRKRLAPSDAEARYDLQGNAWTIPVTELVNFLSHSGKSGLLWVTSSLETFVLEFARGSLVHATSNAPPSAFRLGEILVREKLLESHELEHQIEHARAADDLLGSFLVRSGRLQHSDLQRVLAIQVQELFHRLMDAENALYRFQEGAQLLRSQGLEVNITHLLLESARKKDEARLAAERGRTSGAAELEIPVLDDPGEDRPASAPEPAAALPAAEPETVPRKAAEESG